ncbi:hypothetical protein PISMIDRAFT_18503 [Pisolithus microcarpus 441]|uniref:Uncharacterized protein n=1 Tax=Pisolithus microcarpus 441 TaxID=765257 RepID=A0A0C9YXR6_9AGAM|nr:hypothetical protein PISMIDRAFT_18503 [Pisolithus microcarpus 441]
MTPTPLPPPQPIRWMGVGRSMEYVILGGLRFLHPVQVASRNGVLLIPNPVNPYVPRLEWDVSKHSSTARRVTGAHVTIPLDSAGGRGAFLASAYDPRDLNLYKVVGSDDVIEFLPADEPEESKYLAQMVNSLLLQPRARWKVDQGKKYEVVLTTGDGFWRYRLGDVVEALGFDPRDGQPVVRYVERRKGRAYPDCERGGVSEFCVCPDYRESVGRYAFLVELHGNLGEFLVPLHKPCWYAPRPRAQTFLYDGESAATAPSTLHASLQNLNENYLRDSLSGKIDAPAVRVLRPDTFADFREWKIRTSGGAAVGQVKVPVVVWDEGCRMWLEGRALHSILESWDAWDLGEVILSTKLADGHGRRTIKTVGLHGSGGGSQDSIYRPTLAQTMADSSAPYNYGFNDEDQQSLVHFASLSPHKKYYQCGWVVFDNVLGVSSIERSLSLIRKEPAQ